tara:strand:+ start:9296 stop:9688 length:393 start_codon:yes stop_codon:yes gene_type:complete
MAILNATAVTLSIAGESMAHSTSCSFTINRDLRDSTTKGSNGWGENLSGLMSWEMSGDSFVDILAGDASYKDMVNALIVGSAVTVIFDLDGATETYTGSALITSVSADAGVEDNVSFSVSLTGSGAITVA